MSTPDKQYVALATLDDGSVQLVDYRMPQGQTHRIVREAWDKSRLVLDLNDIPTPLDWHDGFKVSRVDNWEVRLGHVLGGLEDVFDITMSKNWKLTIDLPEPRGNFMGTIKGECDDGEVHINGTRGRGKETGIDLGNYFKYNKGPTKNIRLFSSADEEIEVRLLNTTGVPETKGNFSVRKPWWRWFFLTFYPLIKKLRLA